MRAYASRVSYDLGSNLPRFFLCYTESPGRERLAPAGAAPATHAASILSGRRLQALPPRVRKPQLAPTPGQDNYASLQMSAILVTGFEFVYASMRLTL